MQFSNRFIRANGRICDFDAFEPAPYLRKTFDLDFVPETAEITICGIGFYELSVNGTPLTKGPMAPYINNPHDILVYDHYDLTAHLRKGKNVIAVLLGNGFRNAYGGFVWDFHNAPGRGPVALALCLEATAGEERFVLEADESFRTHPSPILYNDLRLGYCYDSTRTVDGWDQIDFDDSGWAFAERETRPAGRARLCEAEPIEIVEELHAKSVTHHDSLCYYHIKNDNTTEDESTRRNDVYLYDFGQNRAGVTKLRINGRPGQRITVRHGEILVNGILKMNNISFLGRKIPGQDECYKEYNQADVFVCRGGVEEFVPKFKYDGFRYALVEGLDPEQATPEALTYLVMNSALRERGGFSSSDPTLNALQAMVRRSDLANFVYFPTDCPHREKNGWTGDASMSAEHMLLNLTAERSLGEWLVHVRAAQNEAGAFPGIVPTGGWGFHWGNGPTWDSVIVTLPYYVYQYTGNREIIEENLPAIMRYLTYVYSRRDERGLIAIGLGDWVDPNQKQNGKIAAPLEVTDSLMVLNIAKKAAHLFDEIGRSVEADYARSIAAAMRENVRRELIDPETMTVAGNCQTSQAQALAMGVFEEDERDAAKKKLLEIIHRDGDVNACGMIGLRYIFHLLTDLGEVDLAYRIVTDKGRTGYGYWVAAGADTMWETFHVCDSSNPASLNHHFLGDISSWFIRDLAGLRPNPAVNDTSYVEVAPHFVNSPTMTEASAFFDAPLGRVEVRWEREGNTVTLQLTLPAGMHATVHATDAWSFTDGEKAKTVESESRARQLTFTLKK